MSEHNLTPEVDLQRLIRDNRHRPEHEIRAAYRYKSVYKERDPFDFTEDAWDEYVGYGATFQEAASRAYNQSDAAERAAEAWEGNA